VYVLFDCAKVAVST